MLQWKFRAPILQQSLLALALFASACTKSGDAGADSTTALVGAAPESTKAADDTTYRARSGHKGNLDDGTPEAIEYFDRVRFAGPEEGDIYEGTVDLLGHRVTLKIEPALTAHEVSWYNAIKGNYQNYSGHIVARITIQGGNARPSLGLAPNEVGVLWVGEIKRGTSYERGAGIFVRTDTGIRPARKLTVIAGKCPEPHTRPGAWVRDTDACTGPLQPFLAVDTATIRPGPGKGLWVTCSGGCCEVNIT